MKGENEIEARLDRSLRNQVRLPALDARFDAAVWARIARETATAREPARAEVSPRALRASRWLALSNALGIAATLGVACYFAIRALGGVAPAVDLGVSLPLPQLSEATVAQAVTALGYVLGALALAFGLSFTSLGRRLRATFS